MNYLIREFAPAQRLVLEAETPANKPPARRELVRLEITSAKLVEILADGKMLETPFGNDLESAKLELRIPHEISWGRRYKGKNRTVRIKGRDFFVPNPVEAVFLIGDQKVHYTFRVWNLVFRSQAVAFGRMLASVLGISCFDVTKNDGRDFHVCFHAKGKMSVGTPCVDGDTIEHPSREDELAAELEIYEAFDPKNCGLSYQIEEFTPTRMIMYKPSNAQNRVYVFVGGLVIAVTLIILPFMWSALIDRYSNGVQASVYISLVVLMLWIVTGFWISTLLPGVRDNRVCIDGERCCIEYGPRGQEARQIHFKDILDIFVSNSQFFQAGSTTSHNYGILVSTRDGQFHNVWPALWDNYSAKDPETMYEKTRSLIYELRDRIG